LFDFHRELFRWGRRKAQAFTAQFFYCPRVKSDLQWSVPVNLAGLLLQSAIKLDALFSDQQLLELGL
jgi:hypothetical protein